MGQASAGSGVLQLAKMGLGCVITVVLLGLTDCGSSSVSGGKQTPPPAPTPTVAGAIYGLSGPTGVGLLDVLTTGAITSSETIDLPGLSDTGPALRGIAVDPSGEVFVTEQLTLGNAPSGAVLVFAAGFGPTSTPIRTITGSNTQLVTPSALTVDATGDIYVAQLTGDVLEFAAGAAGNAVPIRTLKGIGEKNTEIGAVLGLCVDSSGNLYLMNDAGNDVNNILVFSPLQSGDVAPSRSIAGSETIMAGNTLGGAFDSAGNLYVVTESVSPAFGAILVFAAGATGNVAPIRSIKGSNTTLTASHLTNPVLDGNGNIFLLVTPFGSPSNLVQFAPDANGNALPTATSLAGTTIDSFAIAFH